MKIISKKFKDIPKKMILKFVHYFKKKEFPARDYLWHERDKANGFYVVIKGEVEYTKSKKIKIKTAKNNNFNVPGEEMELVKKNDLVKRELKVRYVLCNISFNSVFYQLDLYILTYLFYWGRRFS